MTAVATGQPTAVEVVTDALIAEFEAKNGTADRIIRLAYQERAVVAVEALTAAGLLLPEPAEQEWRVRWTNDERVECHTRCRNLTDAHHVASLYHDSVIERRSASHWERVQ